MRRITRRYLTRDPQGRAIASESERMTDDGQGRLHLQRERSASWCSGCRRPVVEIAELRGLCDACGQRGCCVHCVSQCRVCSRRLCGACRLGFAGPPPLTVCAFCRPRLIERQLLEDQLQLQQSDFDQEMARQRLFHQEQGLRLMAQRLEIQARLQAARLGGPRPLWLIPIQWMGRALWGGVQYVRRQLP